jgi:hypothetical protein
LGSGLTEMEFSVSRIGGLEGVEGNEWIQTDQI